MVSGRRPVGPVGQSPVGGARTGGLARRARACRGGFLGR